MPDRLLNTSSPFDARTAAKNIPTTIIGAGAVGTAIAIALRRKGYPIVSVISKTLASARRLAKQVDCLNATTQINTIPPSTRLIIVAVPDHLINDIDSQIAALSSLQFRTLLVAHTSGINAASVFRRLLSNRAEVAGIHPIQTFPKISGKNNTPVSLSGVYFGVDCSKRAIGRIRKIVADLQGSMIIVPEKQRALYHAACVFSSSYIIAFLNTVTELSRLLSSKEDWHKVFYPLMASAINNLKTRGAGNSLTGPIVRNDIPTLQAHIHALTKFAPEIISLYTACGIEVARLALADKRISKQEYNSITQLFTLPQSHKPRKDHRKVNR